MLVCLAGSAVSVWQFWQELNKTLVKLNEEPIATITFKQNTAQRKFSDDFVWDRLRQNSPVYNGDTIRTAELSEATIYFNDGNIMDLSENTMARISLGKEGETAVDFSGGQIAVQAAESGLTITSGSSVVDITKGASVTASSVASDSGSASQAGAAGAAPAEEVFRVQVQSGTAAVSTGKEEVSLSAGKTADLKGDGQVEKKLLSVISPNPETKIISFDEEAYPVDFRWDSEGADVKLEFSDTKTFADIKKSYEYSGIENVTMRLSSGTYYWRLTAGKESLNGKITIYESKRPSVIAPVPDYTAYYRTVKPSIRFIWSESEKATTYSFEVADNANMENPVISQRVQQNSSIVTTLSEGKWYWRVTPFYTINNIGFSHPSDVNSFIIEKSGDLVAPELQMPKAGSVVSTKVPGTSGAESQNILFSWKDDVEATSYTVTIIPDSPAYGSTVTQTVNTNFFSLDTSQYQIGNGSWKWYVEMKDVEGNSVKTESIPFFAMDSEISQKPLFPSNGYCLASSRVHDTTFVWRSNISSEMEVQFASDPAFNNIATSLTTKNTSASGIDLPVGTYYWRIVTRNDAGDFISETAQFEVEAPLAAPECLIPEDGIRFVVAEDRTVGLSWKPVETADYYQLRVYGSEDLSDIIYENTYIEDDGSDEYSEKVFFDGMDEKTYYWSVQAYREESETRSRSVGLLGKYSFFLRILKPITLASPGDGAVLEGLDVVMNPPDMEWESIDELNSSELRIYKNSVDEKNMVAVIDNPEMKVEMPRLYEGTYFWTVSGITWDNLDASSKQVMNFRVNKIPPMNAPVQVSPLVTDVFSTAYFDKTLDITFSWNPIMYATKYIFTLKDTDGKVLRTEEVASPRTSCSVDFRDIIHEGTYSWTVEARTVFDDGVIRYGNISTSDFSISLPQMEVPVKNPVSKNNTFDEGLYYDERAINFSWIPVPYADEYVFTLKDSHGQIIKEEYFRNRNALPSSELDEPENSYVFTDVESLMPGSYIWMVEARNYINGELRQKGKVIGNSFYIKVNELSPPVKEYPAEDGVLAYELFDRDEELRFVWQPVRFADEYIFCLYDGDGNLMIKESMEETEFSYMDLDSLTEGRYIWTVEALSHLRGKVLQSGRVEESAFEISFPELEPPEKVLPEENYVIDAEFILADKDLVFSWNSVQYADEYILTVKDPYGSIIREVSITEGGEESSLSYTIPAFDLMTQGTYLWTVEALSHYHGRLLQRGRVEESSFAVTILELDAPESAAPASGYIFDTAFFKKDEPLVFSWDPVPLAGDYQFTLLDSTGTVLEQSTVSETSVSVDPAKFIAPGEYSWTVEAHSYYKEKLFQNGKKAVTSFHTEIPLLDMPALVLPAADETYDTSYFKRETSQSFTWESVPLADEYVFRLENPNGAVIEEEILPADTLTFSVDTERFSYEGVYKWTIEPRTYFREKLLQVGVKASRSFSVVMPILPQPADRLPANGTEYGVALFKTVDAVDFSLHNVDTADCYSFIVRKEDGSRIFDTIIPADSADDAGVIRYRMKASDFMTEGRYLWSVEARVLYKDRIVQSSEIEEDFFTVKLPLVPAPEITSGLSQLVDYDYINAYNDILLQWDSVKYADEYKFTIFNPDDSVRDEKTLPAGSYLRYIVPVSSFAASGDYKWKVEAIVSYQGSDFVHGNEAEGCITIALPELAAAEVISPENGVVLNASYFRKNREIVFSWTPVPYTSGYNFTLYGADGNILESYSLGPDVTEIVFTDLKQLSSGVFKWTVGTYYSKGDKVIVEGTPSENEFSIDLPTLKAPSVGNTGRLYGN